MKSRQDRQQKVARHYLIRGRVQGVGFRYFVQRSAEDLGITGWVRNTDDGAVELLAMGSADQLAALAGYLHRGPMMATVRHVEESEAAPFASDSFVIRG
jgi:acylphosphatase